MNKTSQFALLSLAVLFFGGALQVAAADEHGRDERARPEPARAEPGAHAHRALM